MKPRVILLSILLTAVAWSGLLDQYSEDYVDRAFTGAGLIYATARGINALVSVLQGTELDVVFVTVAVGEALDPINDLIERFSEFVLIALGSLAMQKILLGLVSHTLFNAVLTLLAIGVVYTMLRDNLPMYRALLRGFLVIAFLRFSLGLVVLANHWVDSTFLLEQDQQRHAAMEAFRGELREASALAGAGGASGQLLEQTLQERSRLQSRREHTGETLRQVELELEMAEAQLAELVSADGPGCTAFTISEYTCSPEVLRAREVARQLEQTAAGLEQTTQQLDTELEELTDNLECLQRRARGERCSWLESVTSAVSPQQLRDKIDELEAGVDAFAENVIDLLVSLLLKSIAIPLLFFYLLLRLARHNWSRFS